MEKPNCFSWENIFIPLEATIPTWTTLLHITVHVELIIQTPTDSMLSPRPQLQASGLWWIPLSLCCKSNKTSRGLAYVCGLSLYYTLLSGVTTISKNEDQGGFPSGVVPYSFIQHICCQVQVLVKTWYSPVEPSSPSIQWWMSWCSLAELTHGSNG